jgi:DNA-directed RNA polymerase sigma subunit (sigma70/sigma32)
MAAKLGRDPTPEELADELGWKMEKVLDVLSAPPEPSSLERPVGSADQDDRAQVGDFLADASPDSSPAERAVERSTPTSCDGPSTGPWPGSSPPSGPP